MSELISKLFHEFIFHNDNNGNKEIIRETNAVIAGECIEARTMLDDDLGERYFYECMRLAENVIKSFENDQPTLNPNQQNLLTWMQDVDCDTDDPLEPIVDLFCETTPDGTAWESCLQASYSKLDKKEKLQLAKEYIRQALEQEEIDEI